MLHLCEVFMSLIITARKRSLGQGNIFTPVRHSVHRGGVRGCSEGVCVVAPRGHVWLLLGGVRGCSRGGVLGCSRGVACVVAPGGVDGIRRDTEIQSMSGWYASYWNAFLSYIA